MSKQPKYYQAKLWVLGRVNTLGLRKGDLLPSHSEFIKDADFSMICLRRALDELERDGVIARQQGKRACLVKDVCELPTRGKVLYLHIYDRVPDKSILFEQMRRFFNHHGISLSYASYGRPDPELLKTASGCLGIILSGWITREWVDFLKVLGLPLLVCGSNPFPEELAGVDCDWRDASMLAYQELVRRECRNIILFNGPPIYIPSLHILEGFREASVAESGEFHADRTTEVNIRQGERAYHAISDFLRKQPDADGLIVETGVYPLLMSVLYETDLHHRLKIAGITLNNFDDFVFSRQTFITFKESVFLETARIFLNRLETGDHSIRSFTIAPTVYRPKEETS
jgi:DNA-binding LacI/PurR family transcriptional regulator